MTGSTSTIASVRRSRRIWMNSLRVIAVTREPIIREPPPLTPPLRRGREHGGACPNIGSVRAGEGGIGRHARLELALGVLDADLDPEHQIQAIALGLDIAWRELGALTGGGHHTVERAARERVGR